MIHTPEAGDTVTFYSLAWTNARGGTSMSQRSRNRKGGGLSARATITKAWHDYETGWRYFASLTEDTAVVDSFTKKATTLKKGTRVYVSEFDVKATPRWKLTRMTITEFRRKVRKAYPHIKARVRTVDFTDLARTKKKCLTIDGDLNIDEVMNINLWATEAGILPDVNARSY